MISNYLIFQIFVIWPAIYPVNATGYPARYRIHTDIQCIPRYRLNQLQKSIDIIDRTKNPQLKHTELKAQILYKLENYQNCFDLYRNICVLFTLKIVLKKQ